MQILVHNGVVARKFTKRVKWQGSSLIEVNTGQHRGDNMSQSEYLLVDVPEQELPKRKEGDAPAQIVAKYPEDVMLYSTEEQGQVIDQDTGMVIDKAVHPFAGLQEEIGILRADLAALHVELGVDPTDDLNRLNDIATEKILEGKEKKEALDEGSGSIESAAE